jgi:hypothetical protein
MLLSDSTHAQLDVEQAWYGGERFSRAVLSFERATRVMRMTKASRKSIAISLPSFAPSASCLCFPIQALGSG